MIQKEQKLYQNSEMGQFAQVIEQAVAIEVRKDNGPVFICIGGPSSAGKSTLSNLLLNRIPRSSVMNMDSWLVGGEESKTFNHDAPDPERPFLAALNPLTFDIGHLHGDFLRLLSGITIDKPVFDKQANRRTRPENFGIDQTMIIEGLYALNPEFSQHANFGIFVDAFLHDRFIRKVVRNTIEYKRKNVDWTIHEYLERHEPAFQMYAPLLRKNAKYYFRNTGMVIVPENVELPISHAKGHVVSLEPKYQFGKLHQGEIVSLDLVGDDIYFLYGQDGNIILNEPINLETVATLQKYYNLLPGQIK